MMRKIEKKENVFGGKGAVFFEYLLDQQQLGGMCRLYAKITMKPGTSLGYHVHQGDSEAYYILSGEGLYTNQEGSSTVASGDVTFTADGQGHAIENQGDRDLVFMALVIYTQKQVQA